MTELVVPAASRTSERGWGKLLLALAAFLIVPMLPQFRALLPVDQGLLLLVPALAACTLVGWWAGGGLFLALGWVAIAALMAAMPVAGDGAPFMNMMRGWSLLLAGSFGLVSLFGVRRRLLGRALVALVIALTLALLLGLMGPVSLVDGAGAIVGEFSRRNRDSMESLRQFTTGWSMWQRMVQQSPELAQFPVLLDQQLRLLSRAGVELFPSLLALQSLSAMALAWATYHRLSRTRLGAPLGALRDFRFNDQLVWGLVAGLTFVLLPAFEPYRTFGRNLLIFFGALYALRGLAVLSWYMPARALPATLAIGFAMLFLPVLRVVAVVGFLLLSVASFGIGLGDTWADWRRRARPTT